MKKIGPHWAKVMKNFEEHSRGTFRLDQGTEFEIHLSSVKDPWVGKWVPLVSIAFKRSPVACIELAKLEAKDLGNRLLRNADELHLPKWRTHAADFRIGDTEILITEVVMQQPYQGFRQKRAYTSSFSARVLIKALEEKGILRVEFHTPIVLMSLDKTEAAALGEMLIKRADEL